MSKNTNSPKKETTKKVNTKPVSKTKTKTKPDPEQAKEVKLLNSTEKVLTLLENPRDLKHLAVKHKRYDLAGKLMYIEKRDDRLQPCPNRLANESADRLKDIFRTFNIDLTLKESYLIGEIMSTLISEGGQGLAMGGTKLRATAGLLFGSEPSKESKYPDIKHIILTPGEPLPEMICSSLTETLAAATEAVKVKNKLVHVASIIASIEPGEPKVELHVERK